MKSLTVDLVASESDLVSEVKSSLRSSFLIPGGSWSVAFEFLDLVLIKDGDDTVEEEVVDTGEMEVESSPQSGTKSFASV